MELSTVLLAIIPAVIILFYGFKIQKLVFALSFVLIGYQFVSDLLTRMNLNSTLIFVIALVVGLLFGLVSFKVKQLSIFLFLFALGFMSVYLGTEHVWYNIIIGILLGGVLGFLGVKFYRPMMILSTAFSSGYTISYYGFQYFHISNMIYIVLVCLLLGALGSYYQFKTTKEIKE